MFKVKIILLGFMMSAVGGYCLGAHNELAAIDQEAFDSYVHFTKPLQKEVHQWTRHLPRKAHANADDVFAKAGF